MQPASPGDFPIVSHANGDYTCTTDPARCDVDAIHRFLSEESYWGRGIARATVERALSHSLCFTLIHEPTQELVGFARAVSDFATYAWIADVFVLVPHRGRGLSKQLMAEIIAHPALQDLRKMQLGTRDAQGLYAQFDFVTVPKPQNLMVRDARELARLATEREAKPLSDPQQQRAS